MTVNEDPKEQIDSVDGDTGQDVLGGRDGQGKDTEAAAVFTAKPTMH